MTLVILGVGLAGASYLLNAQPGDSSEELPTTTPRPSDPSRPSADSVTPPPSDSAQGRAENELENRDGIPPSAEASHLGAGRAEVQSPDDSAEDSTVLFEPLTDGATDFPNMKEIDPGESAYDPRLEAQQAFAPMEEDLLAADPLGPEDWRQALETHRLRNAGVSKRAQYLRESGHPELAEDLIAEWGRVYGTWQARAYGRAGPPGYKSPQR